MFLSELKKLQFFFKKDPAYALLLFLCLFLPFQFALNPAAGFDVAIIRIILPLLFLFLIFFRFKERIVLLEIDSLTILLFAFAFLTLFSIVFSSNFVWSLRKLLFLTTIFPVYLISSSLFKTTKRKKLAIRALVIGATAIALVAIAQFLSQFIFGINVVYSFLSKNIAPFFLGHSFSAAVTAYPSWLVDAGGATYMRAFAVFPDPHMLSYYFGILVPWSVALWASAKKHRVWHLASMTLLILADAFTFTRGGYIALIVGIIVVLPVVSKKAALKLALGVLLFAFLFAMAPHSPVATRLTSSFDVQEGSNQARLSNWQQALLIISKHPLGVGVGSYSLAVKPTADYREPIYAHNAYLDVAAELGIPAAILFVVILSTVLKSFWVMSKKDPFFVAGISSITVFSIHSLVENPLYSVHIFPLILIIFALSIPTKKHEEIADIK